MPGRQAHGRSLTAAPKAKAAGKKSKARSQKNALDAFGIAQENFAGRTKKTPRVRELDAEIERKHGRDEDEDEDEDEEEEAPQRKKVKGPRAVEGDGAEYGSDSEGNEWQLGGLAEDDEDSEIESDDAFGDSDEEKFAGYSFGGTKSKQEDDDTEDDENDDEGETLGADAIDLATALDQYESESDDVPEEGSESGTNDSDSDSDASEESVSNDSDEEGEDADPEKLEALRGLISGYGGKDDDDLKEKPTSKKKIGLDDLGLSGLKDPFIKKSVKLMSKEEKEKRPGATSKVVVPLSRREQGRLDRSAAYEKTNETLDRWTDTVKHNRRAEHLVFPLPQNSATAGLDQTEIQPLTAKTSNNELESTIMAIMEQSGLSMEKRAKAKEQELDEEGNELSRREATSKKRMERELNSRETKRAARIKKIKSKAYHRVHRRQRERDEMATQEAMEEAGEIDSEAEREAQDRRRALERVGGRHKNSKWAKLGSKAKRAVWDEDFRSGLTEMARKDEELRRRKEGKAAESDSDDTSSSGSDSEEDGGLHRRLDRLEEGDDEPQTGLMGMKFMQKAEAAKRKANDEMVKQIRRDLDGEGPEESEEEIGEVGRRQYGSSAATTSKPALDTSGRTSQRDRSMDDGSSLATITTGTSSKGKGAAGAKNAWVTPDETISSTGGAWSHGETRRKKKGTSGSRAVDLDLTSDVIVGSRPTKPKPSKASHNQDSDSDSDMDKHLPLAIRDQELVARAFAGEDVVGDFEREKEEIAAADDDKIVDNTLPGWGSWVGEGVSSKELKRGQGRFLTKVEGIKQKNRKDAKLDKVIVSEKRIKKNDRYLASQLPHPFESRQQYERSLRVPVGPEWTTKETFQDSTKPRVLMKQGVIAPISKPML